MPSDHSDVSFDARSFRPNNRLMWLGIALNVALIGVSLTAPYIRGQQREKSLRVSFSSFSACLWGGTPIKGGLGLPKGELFAYGQASQSANWPQKCLKKLSTLRPERATFLFPSTKHAEENLIAAVDLVRKEIEATPVSRSRTPSRPRLASERLRAALALLARNEGVSEALINSHAFSVEVSSWIEPARFPTQASADAALVVEVKRRGLHFTALDSQGVSYVNANAGKVDVRRVRKPGPVSQTHLFKKPAMVWHMKRAKCTPHCERRATGVGWFGEQNLHAPTPRWLGGHMVSQQGALFRSPNAWWLIALEGEQSVLRRFDDAHALPNPKVQNFDSQLTVSPSARFLSPEGRGLLLEQAGATSRVKDLSGESLIEVLGIAKTCVAAGTVWVHSREETFALRGQSMQRVERKPGLARRLVCDETHLYLLGDRDERCTKSSCQPLPVGEVDSDATLANVGEHLVMASTGDGEVTVTVFTGHDHSASIISPCFEEEPGICGPVILSSGHGRVVLLSRHKSDLFGVEYSKKQGWSRAQGIHAPKKQP